MVREALAARAELERQADAAREAALVALQATKATERTSALLERTLMSADIERFLAVEPDVGRLRKDEAATEARLREHGFSVLEYSLLRLRIVLALAPSKWNPGGIGARTEQDREVVRPYAARLAAVLEAR